MPEKTIEQIIQEIKLLYDEFFTLDDTVNKLLKNGLTAGKRVWDDTVSLDIRKKLNRMSIILGAYNLGRQDIIDHIGFDTHKQLAEEMNRLGAKQIEIDNKWIKQPRASLVSAAIVYYKDAPIGSFIYGKTKEYLKKLKESDEAMDKMRTLIKDIESKRTQIPSTSDFWPKYDEMKSKLNEMEITRKLIPFYPEPALYETYGLGAVQFVITGGVILAAGAVIAVLYGMTLAAIPVYAIAYAGGVAIWKKLFATEEAKKEADALAVSTPAKVQRGDPLSDAERKLALDALAIQADIDLDKAKTPEEKAKVSDNVNAIMDAIDKKTTPTSAQSLYFNRAISTATNEQKKKLGEEADAWIDRIMEYIKSAANKALIAVAIGGGVILVGIGLVVILPKILKRGQAPAPAYYPPPAPAQPPVLVIK